MIRLVIIIFSSLFIITPTLASTDRVVIDGVIQENHQQACHDLLREKAPQAALYCYDIFPEQADCCLKELQIYAAFGCVKIPVKLYALQCYNEIIEPYARKFIFTHEKKAGLVDKYIGNWKNTTYSDCLKNTQDNVSIIQCSHTYLMIKRFFYRSDNKK